MTDRQRPDHACTDGCEVDWLLDPGGPADPAWLARVRAEYRAAPFRLYADRGDDLNERQPLEVAS